MPDVQEVFRMATQKVRPDPDALERQFRTQRRRSVQRRATIYAVVAVFAVAASVFAVQMSRRTEQPASKPSPPPEGGISVSDWVPFSSPLYGYSISHPPDWTVTPGTEVWDQPWDWTTETQKSDVLLPPTGGGEVYLHSQAIPAGTTEERWLARMERKLQQFAIETCGREDPIDSIVFDVVEGHFSAGCVGAATVIFTHEGRGYAFLFLQLQPEDLGLDSGEPRALVEALLFTVDLQPDRAADAR